MSSSRLPLSLSRRSIALGALALATSLPALASAALLAGNWTTLAAAPDNSFSDITPTTPGNYAINPSEGGLAVGLPAGLNSIVSNVQALPAAYSLTHTGDSISFTGKFSTMFYYRSGNDYIATIKPANTPLFYFGLLDPSGGYVTRTGLSTGRGVYGYTGNTGSYSGWYSAATARLGAAVTTPAAISNAAFPSDLYSFGITVTKTDTGVIVTQAMKELGTNYNDPSVALGVPAEFNATVALTGGNTTFSSVGFYSGGSTYKGAFTLSDVDVTFTAAVVAVTGDYNHDGFVDAADYTVWADHFGQTGTGIAGDGNNDGVVDAADYTIWADNFGHGTPPSGLSSVVPEPTALALALPAAALLRRRRTN